jgi:hypothetical protein
LSENGVPNPLISICKKALAFDPRRRYDSVRDYARDVENYLSGLPVSVHKETLPERAFRLIKRHRFILFLIASYLATKIALYMMFDH